MYTTSTTYLPENIKKRNARQNTWQKENKGKFNLILPKGRKAEIQEVAKNLVFHYR